MYLSVWLVPRDRAPVPLPPGTRPLSLGGRCLIGTAMVVYEAGSVLRYHELLFAVLVRRGTRLMPSISEIWVDSAVSRDGGRALWGIPKELADFTVSRPPGFGADVRDDRGLIAGARFRQVLPVPGRWPLSYRVAQTLEGALKATPVRCRAAVGLCTARWRIPADGPLGRLAGRRPLAGLVLRDFVLDFGPAAPTTAPDR
jgi:hypothetical protein